MKICPVCKSHVDIDRERHTPFHCRNVLLQKFYREKNSKKRQELEKKIDQLNAELSISSKNLLDT